MVGLKQIFTWWNKNTIGTFLKTIFFGKFVGKDEFGNKYYKNKRDERWIIYANDIEATKITSDWFLWMHHTVNEVPSSNIKKYTWQKKNHDNGLSYWKDEDESQENYKYKSGENVRCKISYFIDSLFKISYTKNYTDQTFSCRISANFS